MQYPYADIKKVYIIEDDIQYGELMSALLQSIGGIDHRVIPNGLEGLAECFREPPDLLILDLMLPSLRGEEILRIIRTSAQFSDMPVIVVSGIPDGQRKEMEMLHIGANIYMKKPFDNNEFLKNVRQLLEPPKVESDTHSDETPNEIFIAGALDEAFDLDNETDDLSSQFQVELKDDTPYSEDITPTFIMENKTSPTVVSRGIVKKTVFEGYRIIEVIGSGGMGTVYKAEQIDLNRIVALKVMLENADQAPATRERFRREALIMATVNHPNIVQIFEVGQTAYTSFFSMEYVDGPSLNNLVRQKPMDWRNSTGVILQVCNAILFLHKKGIIHRDIKLANILIGSDKWVKLTDFGISRARLKSDDSEYTQVLKFLGTPEYMAPELLRLEPATEKTDLFALGKTFWKMLSGPEGKGNALLHEINPSIPKELSLAIDKCQQRDPSQRFESVREARDVIMGIFKAHYVEPILPV